MINEFSIKIYTARLTQKKLKITRKSSWHLLSSLGKKFLLESILVLDSPNYEGYNSPHCTIFPPKSVSVVLLEHVNDSIVTGRSRSIFVGCQGSFFFMCTGCYVYWISLSSLMRTGERVWVDKTTFTPRQWWWFWRERETYFERDTDILFLLLLTLFLPLDLLFPFPGERERAARDSRKEREEANEGTKKK